MVYNPRLTGEIFDSIANRLERNNVINNFVRNSFNYVFIRAFARGIREAEVASTAAQLSGWIDYAGGPITQQDLSELGLDDNLSTERINAYMDDSDLDELVKIVGIERDLGSTATVDVEFTLSSPAGSNGLTIPAGTTVGTQPDSVGNFLEFNTTEELVIDSGDQTGIVEVEAAEIGEQYNVNANQLTYIINPPSGVESVSNPSAASGGIDRESNEDLRERAKRAVFSSTGGGTRDGMIGYIESNVGATDIVIDEYFDGVNPKRPQIDYPHGEVIVEGIGNLQSDDADAVRDAIEESHPTSVKHFLELSDRIFINTEAELKGSITQTEIQDNPVQELEDYYSSLSLGDDIYDSRVYQVIHNADNGVRNIDHLQLYITDELFDVDINSETVTHSNGTDTYALSPPAEDVSVIVDVVKEDGTELVYGSTNEYTVDSTAPEITIQDHSNIPDNSELDIYYVPNNRKKQVFKFSENQSTYRLREPFIDNANHSVNIIYNATKRSETVEYNNGSQTYTINDGATIGPVTNIYLDDGTILDKGNDYTVDNQNAVVQLTSNGENKLSDGDEFDVFYIPEDLSFTEGDDYTVNQSDSTIEWLDNNDNNSSSGGTPDDSTLFTVEYTRDGARYNVRKPDKFYQTEEVAVSGFPNEDVLVEGSNGDYVDTSNGIELNNGADIIPSDETDTVLELTYPFDKDLHVELREKVIASEFDFSTGELKDA